jgi:GTP-binding protein HflX
VLLGPDGEPVRMSWAYNVPAADNRAQPYEIVGPLPYGQGQPDFGNLIGSLEDEFARQARTREVRAKDGQAILIHVGEKRRAGAMSRAKASLDELESLASTAGVEVVDRVIQLRDALDPKYVLGAGKLEDVLMRAIDLDVETLIFDCDLSPAQALSIDARTDLRVLDRTQLILDIFALGSRRRSSTISSTSPAPRRRSCSMFRCSMTSPMHGRSRSSSSSPAARPWAGRSPHRPACRPIARRPCAAPSTPR